MQRIAAVQSSQPFPSAVHFQLRPASRWMERRLRARMRRRENDLVQGERWGVTADAGLKSTLHRAELINAQRTQNHAVFRMETYVVSNDENTCKAVADAVEAPRAENALVRQFPHLLNRLYRRRFPAGLPPLVPDRRTLVSSAELAWLLELPSRAEMRNVPTDNLALPRMPAPPEVLRAPDDAEPDLPPAA
jgi:hypothetical protein